MKIIMIANILIICVYIICVTTLSIVFNKTSLLWWFILAPFLGYEYTGNNDDHPTEKGGAK